MKMKKLLMVAVAAAFTLPFAAQVSAAGDNMILAQGAGAPPSGASSVGTGPTGGTASPQSAGEPKAPTADSKRCEPMTGAERDKCMREARASGGAAAGGATSSSGTGKTGTTAGPGEASPKTGTGSATATKPDTSGTGKAQ